VRWESNGEAKAVFVGSGFEPNFELFPNQEESLSLGENSYVLKAFFEDALEVRRR
jgi:hypothetical protein